jgi:uncharacterized protein (DUF433 family)
MKPKTAPAARRGKGYSTSANRSPRVREDSQRINARHLERITFNPARMGGKPCIRDLRVTVGTIVGLLAGGHSKAKVLQLYPYLEPEDIDAALTYAAWRAEERELPLQHA